MKKNKKTPPLYFFPTPPLPPSAPKKSTLTNSQIPRGRANVDGGKGLTKSRPPTHRVFEAEGHVPGLGSPATSRNEGRCRRLLPSRAVEKPACRGPRSLSSSLAGSCVSSSCICAGRGGEGGGKRGVRAGVRVLWLSKLTRPRNAKKDTCIDACYERVAIFLFPRLLARVALRIFHEITQRETRGTTRWT